MFFTADQEKPWPDDDATYEQKTVDTYMYGGTDGPKSTIALRYYSDQPNVPYVGLTDYYSKIQNAKMEVRYDGGSMFTIKDMKPNTPDAKMDLAIGTISSNNYIDFDMINVADSGESMMLPILKEGAIEELVKAHTTTIDFGKYGIKGHSDKSGKEIWLPFQTVADLFYNGSNFYSEYTGDSVYFSDVSVVMS